MPHGISEPDNKPIIITFVQRLPEKILKIFELFY